MTEEEQFQFLADMTEEEQFQLKVELFLCPIYCILLLYFFGGYNFKLQISLFYRSNAG